MIARINVSLPEKMKKQLKTLGISPSKLLQDAIIRVSEQRNSATFMTKSETEAKMSALASKLNKAFRFIEQRGETNGFLEWEAQLYDR